MFSRSCGPLFLIGGHEQNYGRRDILRQFAAAVSGRPLVIVTIASEVPVKYWAKYRRAFSGLPIGELRELGGDPAVLDGAGGVFITGGKQQRIMQHLDSGQVGRSLRALWRAGAAIAEHPPLVGIGVDEDTALVIGGGHREVIGARTVTIIDHLGTRVHGRGDAVQPVRQPPAAF